MLTHTDRLDGIAVKILGASSVRLASLDDRMLVHGQLVSFLSDLDQHDVDLVLTSALSSVETANGFVTGISASIALGCTEVVETTSAVHPPCTPDIDGYEGCTALYEVASPGGASPLYTKPYTPGAPGASSRYKGCKAPLGGVVEGEALCAPSSALDPDCTQEQSDGAATEVAEMTRAVHPPYIPRMEPVMPRLQDITRIEVQAFRNPAGSNRSAWTLKCFVQTDPLHLMWRKIGRQVYANLTTSKVLRRTMKGRVQRGSLSDQFRQEMDEASRELTGRVFLGLFQANSRDNRHTDRQAAILNLDDTDEPNVRLFLHGELITIQLKATNNANPKASVYLGYYDPLDYAAYRLENSDERRPEATVAPVNETVLAEVAILRREVSELRRRLEQVERLGGF